jgi:hypothetical protein
MRQFGRLLLAAQEVAGDTGNLLVALVPIETVPVEDDMTGLGSARSVRYRRLFWGRGTRRTEALQGVRLAVFLNILNRWESAELNLAESCRG